MTTSAGIKTHNAPSINHEIFMRRCLHLATHGLGKVAPNPMVGAVLVYDNRIIGEGYHKKYGESHAEPNCIASVRDEEQQHIKDATLYVSLEPCTHFGKTPPCADLIIKKGISKVVIGCRDPFKEVDGKGIEKLQQAGIDVTTGVLENECKTLNKRFLTFHTQHRPYIILKWAQTADRKIAGKESGRLHITNEYTNRIVHKWRSEESSILVGSNTVLVDDPELTTRLWPGNNPVRLVTDLRLKIPSSSRILNDKARTIIFNTMLHEERGNLLFYKVTGDLSLVQQVLDALYQLNLQTLLVEGGARSLQSFIDQSVWDEARVITNEELFIDAGLNAPELSSFTKVEEQKAFSDKIEIFKSNLNPYL